MLKGLMTGSRMVGMTLEMQVWRGKASPPEKHPPTSRVVGLGQTGIEERSRGELLLLSIKPSTNMDSVRQIMVDCSLFRHV